MSVPSNEVPSAVADKVVGIFPDWPLQNLSPVLQILPCLLDCGTREWRETSQSLEVHTPKTPVVDRKFILISFQNFRGHVIWGTDD